MKKLTPWMFVAIFGMIGCSSNDNDDDPVVMPPAVAMTKIQVVHASPDAPLVDLILDSAEIAADVDYKQATSVTEITAGSHTAEVKAILPDGTTIDAFDPVTADFTQDLIYSVLAVNNTANIEPLILTRSDEAVASTDARVQIVHAAPQAPMVDVYVTEPDADLSQSTVLVTASFKQSLDATTVTAGDYQIRITLAGDTDSVVFDSGAISLPGSADWLVAAIENTGPGDQPVNLLLVSDSGATELLDVSTPALGRVVHASADAPAVDIVANNMFDPPLVEDLAFAEFTDYDALAAGSYNIKVVPTGTEMPVVIDADVDLVAGIEYNLIAVNELASIAPLILTADNRRVATESKVRMVHASPTAGNVDIYLVEVGTDISTVSPTLTDVALLADTDFLSVTPGSYDVVITATGSTDAAIGPVSISVDAAGIYTAIARDAQGGGAPLGLILLDDFVQTFK